jgi:hypothetical protein
MLPVSSWPPGPPGSSLSPFGKPREINVGCEGFVLPKGAWIVRTTGNRVVMFWPPIPTASPARSRGTGLLPGSIPPARPRCSCPRCTPSPARCTPTPCPPPGPRTFHKFNDVVEAFRAWQRTTGNTDPPLRPLPGRRPPNWFGWKFDPSAPCAILVQPASAGLVVADGQNVVVTGGGFASITQAYSV